jgi:hypothetical protein
MNFEKFITSSSDPRKLSLTVKGFLLAILPIILAITGMTEGEVQPIIDVVVDLTFYLTSIIAGVQMLIGLVRKVKLGRWSAKE